MSDYLDFLRAKAAIAPQIGRTVDANEIHPILKPHQRAIAQWAVAGGRRAIFAKFGLVKSVMQLETLRLTLDGRGRSGSCRGADAGSTRPRPGSGCRRAGRARPRP